MIFVFIGIFVYALPSLFRLPLIHEKIETLIARRVKGDFSFREGSLTLLPKPRIRFHNVILKTGSRVSATIDMVSAYPSLPSLFLGKVNIARVTVVHPDFIAEIPEPEGPSPSPATVSNLRNRLEACVNRLAPVTRGKLLSIDIQKGAVTLIRADKRLFSMQEISSRVQWKLPAVSIDIAGKSDIWDEGRLTFNLDMASQRGDGQISLKRMAPKTITDSVFPKNFPQVEGAVLDMEITLHTSKFDTLDLSFEVLDPDITLRKGKKTQTIRGEKAAGTLKMEKTSTHVSITGLDLATPRLQLTGRFDLNSEKPSVGWRVNARDVDIVSTRAAAGFFAAWSKVARRICDILIEGNIPQISLGQEARNLDGFRDVSTFYLHGRLNRGAVHIPKTDLLLTDASGDVNISKGILEASYIKARLGNSDGSQGRFSLSLKKRENDEKRPFYVETDIHADIAALPSLLDRLVKNRLFSNEMQQITSAEGTAIGKMILDRESGRLRTTVDVSKFDISATYDRIPFPLSVSGGGFHFVNGVAQVRDIQGNIGDSRFIDLSGKVSWDTSRPPSPVITISKGRTDANVDEIVSWLETNPTAGRVMKKLHAEKGRISIDNIRLEGPARTPRNWQFQLEGHVIDTVTLLMPLFPNPLIFHQCQFTATQDKIDFSSDDLSLLDAQVHATGTLHHYKTKNRQLEARIDGELGGGACQWIHRQVSIPEMCRWRAPITLSSLFLNWQEKEGLNVSGEATAGNRLLVAFDITKSPGALAINNLAIQDGDALATLTLLRDKNLLEIGFAGELNGSSLSALLLENDLLAGSIRGNFKALYIFNNPLKSTLMGDFRVTGLDTTALGVPLKITEAALTADRTSIEISPARFTWKESDFSTSGRIAHIEKGLLLDIDLDSKRLDWSELKASLGNTRTTKHTRPSFLFGNVRATCGSFTISPTMVFQPLEAEFQLDGNRVDIIFHQADACGISFPGTITLTPEKTLFSFEPFATGQALAPTLACLKEGKKLIDGRFDLNGKLEFELNGKSIMESLDGEATLTAKDGRIYRAVLLGKIFSLLDIGGILSGEFPDLEKEGLPYKKSVFKGQFNHGRFELETGVIDSSGMKIFYEGEENLIDRKHDLTVIVAPLKTVDSVVEKIPLVNTVFDKGAVIYPVKVTGPWDKPDLSLLSPTAVGGEVWGIMVRTLRLPITLLESIFSGKKKEE